MSARSVMTGWWSPWICRSKMRSRSRLARGTTISPNTSDSSPAATAIANTGARMRIRDCPVARIAVSSPNLLSWPSARKVASSSATGSTWTTTSGAR